MSELKPCPFCGGKVEPEDMGEAIVICCPCDLTPCAARATREAVAESWDTRSLAPALDVVIAEVEAWTSRSHDPADAMRRNMMLGLLRALRGSQSATHSPSGPSGPAAQPDTGEQEGG